jgi:phosphoribosylformylglycinamidine synthase subunit PurS
MPSVRVLVTLKPSLLDSEGRAVANSLVSLGYPEVKGARIGKVVELDIEGDPNDARVREMCERLLANTVIEDYSILP